MPWPRGRRRRARAGDRRRRPDCLVAARAAQRQRHRAPRRRAAAHPPDRSAPRRHRPGVAAGQPPRSVDELAGRGRHDVHRRLGHRATARSAPVRRCTSGRARWTTRCSPTSPTPRCVAEIRVAHRHDVPHPPRAVGVPRLVPPPGARRAPADGRGAGPRRPGDRRGRRRRRPASAITLDDGGDDRRRRRGPRARSPRRRARRRRARRSPSSPPTRDLTFIPAGHTAELDLSALEPGADVIALGFGQAFTDLLVLLTEGRGGRFVDDGPTAPCATSRAAPSRCCTSARAAACRTARRSTTGCRRRRRRCRCSSPMPRSTTWSPSTAGWCSVATCCRWCARRSAGRRTTSCSTPTPSGCARAGSSSPSDYAAAPSESDVTDVVRGALCHDEDVFDIERINRPLAGLQFPTRDALEEHVRDHVAGDVARRTDPTYSADLGAFNALLRTFGVIGRLGVSGRGHRPLTDRGDQRLVVQLLHVLRQRTAAGPAAPAARAGGGRRRALHRRRHHGATRRQRRGASSPRARATPRRSAPGP